MPRLKKSLGQNFLVNSGICQRIAGLLAPDSEYGLFEIGPGAGALTRYLLDVPHARLVLLEKDRYWAAELARNFYGAQVIMGDALQFDWGRLCHAGQWQICGNLPYNVASPLIWEIISRCHCLARAVFMVQKEVAQRLVARPGTKAYGALSVWIQCHATAKLEFVVSPGNFKPAPKVDSAVVSFRPLPKEKWPNHPESLKNLLRLCFQNRRKQLGGIFRRAGQNDLLFALEKANINPALRPENLGCQEFITLAGIMAAQK